MDVLTFKLEGPAFDGVMPLDITLSGLNSFQNIIDKAFLEITDAQRMSRKSREQFRILIKEVRNGSLETDIQFCAATMATMQTAFNFLLLPTPETVWKLTKDSFNFLTTVLKGLAEGKTPTYKVGGDGNITVITGDSNIIINKATFNLSKRVLPDYQDLARLKEDGVDDVSCGEKNGVPDVKIDSRNRQIFFPKREIVDETIRLDCEIFDFDKYHKRGKLTVFEGQAVPRGEYSFEVVGDQDIVKYIESMLRTRINISCLKEVAQNAFGGHDIAKIQVITIN